MSLYRLHDGVCGWKTSISEDFWKDWMSSGSMWKDTKFVNYATEKKDDSFTTKIVVPGVNKEDLDLTVANNKLTVTLEKDSEFVSAFTHIIELQEYNEDTIKTSLVNGVLEIHMEKKTELKPKKLKI